MLEDLYIIANKKFVGNCVLMWAIDGHGYTCDFRKAWKVDLEKAKKICSDRPNEDFYFRIGDLDIVMHVGAQNLKFNKQ